MLKLLIAKFATFTCNSRCHYTLYAVNVWNVDHVAELQCRVQ